MKVNFKKWADTAWTLEEAAQLLAGQEPAPGVDSREGAAKEIHLKLKVAAALFAATAALPTRKHVKGNVVAPAEILELSRKMSPSLPVPAELKEAILAADDARAEKDPRATRESTYLHIIGALLEIIDGKTCVAHPGFRNPTDLVNHLADMYGGFAGISDRTLHEIFPEARRRLQLK